VKRFLVWALAGSLATPACAVSGGTITAPASEGDVKRVQRAAGKDPLDLNYVGSHAVSSSGDADHPNGYEPVVSPLERKYGSHMSRLLGVSADGGLVFQNPAGASVAIPLEALQSVDVRNQARGAAQGFVGGLILGLLVGEGVDAAGKKLIEGGIGGVFLTGFLFAIPGTIIGAVTGSPTRFEVARARAEAPAALPQSE
jgi:hypothetical protein